MKTNIKNLQLSLSYKNVESQSPNNLSYSTKLLKNFFSEDTHFKVSHLERISLKNKLRDTDNDTTSLNETNNINLTDLYRWKLLSLLYSNIYKTGDIPPPTVVQTYKEFLLCGTNSGSILVFNENEFLILQLKISIQSKKNESILKITISDDGKVVAGCTSTGKVALWNLAMIEENFNEELTEINEYQIIHPKEDVGLPCLVNQLDFTKENNSIFVTYKFFSEKPYYESYIYTIKEKEEMKWFSKSKDTFIDAKKIIFSSSNTDYYSAKLLNLKLQEKDVIFVAVALKDELRLVSLSNRNSLVIKLKGGFEQPGLTKAHEWYVSDSNQTYTLGLSRNNTLKMVCYSLKEGTISYDTEHDYFFGETIQQAIFITNTLLLVTLENGSFYLLDTQIGKAISSSRNQAGSFHTPLTYSDTYGILFTTGKGLVSGKLLSWQNIIMQELRVNGPTSSLDFLTKICVSDSNNVLRKLMNLNDKTLHDNRELKNTFISLVNSAISKIEKGDVTADYSILFSTISKLDYFFHSNDLTICCQMIDDIVIKSSEQIQTLLSQSVANIFLNFGHSGSYFPPELVNFVLEHNHSYEDSLNVVETVSSFDARCVDIDFIMRYFRQNKNFRACVNLCASVFGDLNTPLKDMISILSGREEESNIFGKVGKNDYEKIMNTSLWFLDLVLNNEELNQIEDYSTKQKNILSFLINATTTSLFDGGDIVYTKDVHAEEPLYPYLVFYLKLNGLAFLNIVEKVGITSSEYFDKLLNTLTTLLDGNIDTNEISQENIKRLGMFITLHIVDSSSKNYRKNIFPLLYDSLTVNNDFSAESEAALLILMEVFGTENLSEETMIQIKNFGYLKCLLWVAIDQENYFECIKLSLELELITVFDFIEAFYETRKADNTTLSMNSPSLDVNEHIGNNTEIAEYELERLIYDSFVKFYEIDNQKAVELIYFYDYDIKTVFDNIHDIKTKIAILEVIVEDSRLQVPNFLCAFYIKNTFEIYGKTDKSIEKIKKLLDNITFTSGNFTEVVKELKSQHLGNLVVKVYRLTNRMDDALTETLKEYEIILKSQNTYSMRSLEELLDEAFNICRKGNKKELWSKFITFSLKVYENCEFEDIKEHTMDTLSKICFALTTESVIAAEYSIVDVFVNVLEAGDFLLSKSKNVSDSLIHVFKILKIEMQFYKTMLRIFNEESEDLANSYNLAKLKGLLATYKPCDVCGDFNKGQSEDRTRYYNCGHLIHDSCADKSGSKIECCVCKN